MKKSPADYPCKLSALVVSYNHEAYIGEALESILAQAVDFPLEIVVADDHSTDRTVEIVREYQREDGSAIRLLDGEQNLGVTKNYQRGFAACAGEYIAVLEGDDTWLGKERLNLLVRFLDEHPECTVVFNRILYMDENTQSCRPLQWDSNQPFELKTGADLAYTNFIGNFSACIFRSAAVRKLDPHIYDQKMYDWLFNMSLARFGLIAYIPRILSVYRQHSDGTWSGMDMEQKLRDTSDLIPVYDAFLQNVYAPQFAAHRSELLRQIDIIRLQKMREAHRGNPLVTGYVLMIKIWRRLKRVILGLLGRR